MSDAHDLFAVLKMLAGTNLTDGQLQFIAVSTIEGADNIYHNGSLDFEEFKQAFQNLDMEKAMTIDF